ncbi:cytochrome P450 [Apiospora kogelbergensis]|uniref:cytochrome P450 n=1 Tax=Apiospora kogelbergensis TaxID=1337665 RepID=UPI003131ECAB
MFTDLLSTTRETWLILIAVATLTFAAYKLRSYHKLRHIPGPTWTGLSDIPHIRAFLSERCCEWYSSVSETHGPLARVGPNTVLTSSAEFWESVNVKPGYKRSKWFYNAARFDWRRDNCFTMIDVEQHDARRKRMAPGVAQADPVLKYSGRENLELERDIDVCVVKFVHLIGSYADIRRNGAFDLANKLQFLTLDVIGLVGFGKSFGLLDVDADPHEFVRSTEDGLRRINKLMALGLSWTNRVPFLGPSAELDAEKAKGFDKMLTTSSDIVEARERAFRKSLESGSSSKAAEQRADMLASFMRNGLLGDELKTESLLQIVAGSDTTAGALRGTMLYLVTHPRAYRALQIEIDAAVREGQAPGGPGEVISYAQTKALPYLQAVVREGIRIFPPLTDPFARDVPPGGDTVIVDGRDVFIPGGVSVIPSWTAMHRDRKLYGEDAGLFRPERWLESEQPDADRLRAMRRTNDLMFGHGKYTCLGKPVALIEIHKTIFEASLRTLLTPSRCEINNCWLG